jgi:Pyruvate/2-oxoacid:ferredoxin oxidoreductase delta subunit
MRPLLAVACFLSLLAFPGAALSDAPQPGFPGPAPIEKPRVEQAICIQCHATTLVTPAMRGIPNEWRQSVHYRNGVGCNDCHGGDPHNAGLAMSPKSGFVGVPKPKEVPQFCGKCHVGIMKSYLESDHGKALLATGRGPNCVLCHGSHSIQPASLNIINEKLCGICHSYARAQDIKASLLLTEQKINQLNKDLKTLKAGLIATGEEEKTLFRTQAEYRTLFHSVDVNLVKSKTAEFTKKLAALSQQVQKGFQELKFRQNFAIFIMLIFIGLGIALFCLIRKSD